MIRRCYTTKNAYAAAHRVTCLPSDHECAGIHGHTSIVTWTIEVSYEGPIPFDWARLQTIGARAVAGLNHRVINDVAGCEDGSAESQLDLLVEWLGDELREEFVVHDLHDCEVRLVCVVLTELTAVNGMLAEPTVLWRPD